MNGFDFDDEAGIEAIIRSREAGFRFTHMGSADEVVAIHGERRHAGAVDVFLVRAVDEAYAARFRTSDYGSGMPLWQRSGEAADVINDLLDLPPHDSPGAPKRPLHGPGTDAGNLWFPGLP